MKTWDESMDIVGEYLEGLAAKGQTTTYDPPAALVGMGGGDFVFWRLLGDISRRSAADRGVLLTAIVVNKESNYPGADFYTLAPEIRQDVPHTADERLVFWTTEVQRVFDAYKETKRPAAGSDGSLAPTKSCEEQGPWAILSAPGEAWYSEEVAHDAVDAVFTDLEEAEEYCKFQRDMDPQDNFYKELVPVSKVPVHLQEQLAAMLAKMPPRKEKEEPHAHNLLDEHSSE